MIFLILVLIFQSININVYASNNTTYYARIMYEQVYLYKNPIEDDSITNIYFELPKTYFVEICDVENNFYLAKYQNLIGYVKKNSVQAVDSIPAEPFLNNITFRVYSELSERLFSLPESSSMLITKIPSLTRNIQYFGKVYGERLIDGRTNIWYYCKFSSTTDFYGYVYSDFCDEMPKISNNVEELNYINNPTFEVNKNQVQAIPKDSNSVGLVVGILTIPALIFVFMLIKGSKIIKEDKSPRKEVVDYKF